MWKMNETMKKIEEGLMKIDKEYQRRQDAL
jgi:hypothetical protein